MELSSLNHLAEKMRFDQASENIGFIDFGSQG